MKYTIIFCVIACAALVSAAPSTKDCDGALPTKICSHLQSLEKITTNLAKHSINMVAKSVELAAEKQAKLFDRIMALVNTTQSKKPTDTNQLAKMLKDLMELMEKAEGARDKVLEDARKAISEASMEIPSLIQQIISDAANGSLKDLVKLQMALRAAMKSAHLKIRAITFKAIMKVRQANEKVEEFVVKILAKLGNSRASMAKSFADTMSMEESMKIADDGEHEIEAEFDEAAKKGFELVVLSKTGKVKRSIFRNWWNAIKSKLVTLKNVIVDAVKKAVAIIWPQIKQKLTEIVQIILNTAKQAIVDIAGQMILVNVP